MERLGRGVGGGKGEARGRRRVPEEAYRFGGNLGDGDWRLSLEKQRVIVHGVRDLGPGCGVRGRTEWESGRPGNLRHCWKSRQGELKGAARGGGTSGRIMEVGGWGMSVMGKRLGPRG